MKLFSYAAKTPFSTSTDMDDLDNALFGRSTGPKTKPSLGNLDSLFGEAKKPAAKKSTVSFLDAPAAASTAPHAPTKSTLDDLFADTAAEQKPAATATSVVPTPSTRPSRAAGTPSLGSLLGPSRRDKEAKPAAPAAEPAQAVIPAPQVAASAPEEVLRAKRKQITKLQDEHSEELERIKSTYERQLDTIQQSAGQWRAIFGRKRDVTKAKRTTIGEPRTEVTEFKALEYYTALSNKSFSRLLDDRAQFEEERKKVYELNAKLNELVKGQETVMEQDKYRVREEWNRLNAEKAVFKEDQRFILENIEKQKAALDRSKTAFFQEQHDLLVRVSTERQLLEQEKNEFHGKRSTDVRRLKEEASELQRRALNVLAAERNVDEMKKHYEAKMRQLQELEVSLMEECVEMENLRTQMSTYKTKTTPGKVWLEAHFEIFSNGI
ncbi:hypothetical protein OESDEN_02438 [Oesophagostomum dentatum]|uniref:Fas-binding factor 1 C-terminal domain-containing protein n=1 Tax=Oesophagostomum dentatum TaxID=61180 RepID=A0A0B1TK05_OESDE|nr:hypothetical protein OESDEN_02438 [Oesophagostomum dentatum]